MSAQKSTNERFVRRAYNLLSEFAVFLLLGTATALIWANLDWEGYGDFVERSLFTVGGQGLSFHFLVNDVFMALFFGIAMKEVTESVLPGGVLADFRKAAMPALATAGGVIGPILVFFALHGVLSPEPPFSGGWAIPTATDIAYSWLVARLIFGRAHPAVTFLLVLAVLDDLVGMGIIALFYTPHVELAGLGLVAAAMVVCEILRRSGIKNFWAYLSLGGALSWLGLYHTGVHAALALVPVIPFMPHALRDAGIFIDESSAGGPTDTLNRFEHVFKPVVDIGLFGFGLANAGVALNWPAFSGKATWIVLLSLLVGKTAGITLFSWAGERIGLELPQKVRIRQMIAVGLVAGIGFTVALFVADVYVDMAGGRISEAVAGQLKLGALLSFSAAPLAFLAVRLLGLRRSSRPGGE